MRICQRAPAASTTGTAGRFRPHRITATTALSSWTVQANRVNGSTHHDLPGRHHERRPDPKASTSGVASRTVTSPSA
ncbi:hypothetical protein ACSDR0_23425 [Streptosporangium sp. G11]|uniref:hypothetical protein n=1 Tax=Streptosporangium sp. G11 TaxID=3436926 RepID=UPI003EC01206